MNNQLFNQAKEKHLSILEQYVPVVARVHGASHPEFYDVHKIFDTMTNKIKEAGLNKPELKEEFAKLQEVTDNYRVPGDVCESYEAVYTMLEDLNQAYRA